MRKVHGSFGRGVAAAIVVSIAFAATGCGSTAPSSVVPADRARTVADAGRTTERSLSEWLTAQLVASEYFYVGTATVAQCHGFPVGLSALIDFEGFYAHFSPASVTAPVITGTVRESMQADGTALIAVNTQTTNAAAYVACQDFLQGPLLLGSAFPGARSNATASISYSITFTMPKPGLPLPWRFAIPGANVQSEKFHASGTGPLGAAFGPLAGSPGAFDVEATGTLRSTGEAAEDGFTAEFIHVGPAGP